MSFNNRVAGADDVSDGSRPGTPLFDERPENINPKTAQTSLSNLRSAEPMSLPLPSFASQVSLSKGYFHYENNCVMFASTFQVKSPKLALPSATQTVAPILTTPSAPMKKDPRLKSPTSINPVIALKSPPTKHVSEKSSPVIVPHDVIGGAKPIDPRLGLLQLAATTTAKPLSPSPLRQQPTNSSDDIEDISDGEKETDLEERLRALDEKFEKWTGSTKQVAVTPSSGPQTPVTGKNMSLKNVKPRFSTFC